VFLEVDEESVFLFFFFVEGVPAFLTSEGRFDWRPFILSVCAFDSV